MVTTSPPVMITRYSCRMTRPDQAENLAFPVGEIGQLTATTILPAAKPSSMARCASTI